MPGRLSLLYLRNHHGIVNTWPTLMLLMLVILLADAIAATVVPYLTAIAVSVSPAFMVYVLGVAVEPPSAGIATATGIVN